MSLEALLWDVDGTLAETEETHRRAFNQAFAEHGLPWHWDRNTYARLLPVAGGKERIASFLESELFGEVPRPSALIANLHARKTAIYASLLQEGMVRLRPGVARLLDEAKRSGLKLAIATTTTAVNVETLLAATLGKDAPAWDGFVAGDAVARKKPAPDVYLSVLSQMGLKPSQCLAIEDSHSGLCSSLAARIACIVTPSQYTQQEDFQGALAVLDSLGDPDFPSQSINGTQLTHHFVNVSQLRIWHEATNQPQL